MDTTLAFTGKARWATSNSRCKLDDQILIKNALQGDKTAFKELIHKYESQVAATVIGMLGSGPEAEDVGQEVFIRFYRSLNRFRGESALGTYLTRIAINLCINELRKRQHRRKLHVNADYNPIEDVPDKRDPRQQHEAAEMVHWGLRQVPAKYRAVIVLRLIDGYTTEETARILELPLGTVLSRLARGQQKLREILKPHYEERKNGTGENNG
jgi:RNA polymerase sigma-70 factor (ECF subfamily)